MTKKNRFKLWILTPALVLSGCIGSQLVLDDDDGQQVYYPNLQDVPDRPQKPDFEKMHQEEIDLTQQQSRELEFNRELRRQVL